MCHLHSMVMWCVCCRGGNRGYFWTCYCNSHCCHWRVNSITVHIRKDHWLHWGSTVSVVCCGYSPGILLIGCMQQNKHTSEPYARFDGARIPLVVITANRFLLHSIVSILLTYCFTVPSKAAVLHRPHNAHLTVVFVLQSSANATSNQIC